MTTETIASFQNQLEEYKAELELQFWKTLISILISFWHIIIVAIVVVLIIVIVLLLCGKIKIPKLGPFEFVPSKKEKLESLSKEFPRRQVTDSGCPGRDYGLSNVRLSTELKQLVRDLKQGTRKRVLIRCRNLRYAEELGKLIYEELENAEVPEHIGWVYYRKKYAINGYDTLEGCMNRFFIRKDETDTDPNVRHYRRLALFKSNEEHTVLFLSMKEYPQNDDAFATYSNMPGLSMILLSARDVPCYQTIQITENGGVSR